MSLRIIGGDRRRKWFLCGDPLHRADLFTRGQRTGQGENLPHHQQIKLHHSIASAGLPDRGRLRFQKILHSAERSLIPLLLRAVPGAHHRSGVCRIMIKRPVQKPDPSAAGQISDEEKTILREPERRIKTELLPLDEISAEQFGPDAGIPRRVLDHTNDDIPDLLSRKALAPGRAEMDLLSSRFVAADDQVRPCKMQRIS